MTDELDIKDTGLWTIWGYISTCTIWPAVLSCSQENGQVKGTFGIHQRDGFEGYGV